VPRQTADLVALILAIVVALVVILTAVVLLYIALTQPGRDMADVADAIGRIVAVLVGALVGYMAGRRTNGGSE